MNPQPFRSDPVDTRIWINLENKNPDSTCESLLVDLSALCSLHSLSVLVIYLSLLNHAHIEQTMN